MNTPLQHAVWAVIARWESPAWKDMPHTGEYIDAMRKALADEQAQEPVAFMTEDGRVSMAGTVNGAMPKAAKDSFCIPLFARPAPPATGERAGLAAFAAECSLRPNSMGDKLLFKRIAEMLEADAALADKRVAAIAADREYWRERAQQVAVPATVVTLKRYEPELYDEDRVRMELDSNGDWVKYSDFLAQQVAVTRHMEEQPDGTLIEVEPWVAQQVAVPVPMSEDEKSAAWFDATIEMASHENCYLRGVLDAEAHHGIGAKK